VLSLAGVLVVAPDAAAQTTVRASVASNGAEANGSSSNAKISADRRFVAFGSLATNLGPPDLNFASDIFRHDVVTGITIRVSVDSNGVQGNGGSYYPAISGDGRFVAFQSEATNLVPGDTNLFDDIFVHDVLTGTTTRASLDANGLEATGDSTLPAISQDGRFVAFSTFAPLVSEDTNGASDIYVRDLVLRTTTLVSVGVGGLANGDSFLPSLSADGRFVAFQSEASNLVVGDTNARSDIFVHDRVTGSTQRVSVGANGVEGNGSSLRPSISADGNRVAFDSAATNLGPPDANGVIDVFVRDISAGTTTRVSRGLNGAEPNDASWEASISPDGRFVAYGSFASNVVEGDTNGMPDIFVHDLTLGTTSLVSVGIRGESNGPPPGTIDLVGRCRGRVRVVGEQPGRGGHERDARYLRAPLAGTIGEPARPSPQRAPVNAGLHGGPPERPLAEARVRAVPRRRLSRSSSSRLRRRDDARSSSISGPPPAPP
jgi:Tol biopolymer transport system component